MHRLRLRQNKRPQRPQQASALSAARTQNSINLLRHDRLKGIPTPVG